jgi:hypothetical protein
LGCRFALITNGAKLTLVAVADGVVGHGTWHATLFQAEPVHLDSLRAVLNATRFYGVADDQTPEALLDTSIARQQELTGDLGDQVRRAAELLVGALSRADRRHGRVLLADVPGRQVYEAAVTVLMRIVFLLTAEERGLLPANNAVYRDDYAIGTLRDYLAETLRTGRASAQRRSHAWHRLLALSRAVHTGVEHDQLRLPGYGGRLFDPDRFPFLEGSLPDGGRLDADLVDDHTVHEILTAIQVVDGRPIAFRALEVEQIGHVYESLLDHSAVTAEVPVVGLIGATRGLEPEVALDELEAARLAGDEDVLDLLAERTGKKATWLAERLAAPLDERVERTLRAACGNDADLHDRVRPFGNLLRLDLRGLPLVFLPGDTYVTETSAKRDSGTAYTTRELAEEIAKHALDPLMYSPGPQDSGDPADWKLRSSKEILELKVCDPAVGSGAIIVAAVRYLADALVRAWLAEGEITDQDLVAGEATGQLDVTVRARREVVARCIYAVDRDPMAIDMAKMSLWLVTMAKDHPFTFLDHAIKCGDALLGITDLDQLTWLHLDPKQGRKVHRQAVIPTEFALAAEQPSLYAAEPQQQSLDYGHFSGTLDGLITKARDARESLRDVPDTDLDAEATKAALLAEADDAVDRLRVIADVVVAAALASASEGPKAYGDRLKRIAGYVGQLADITASREALVAARQALESRSATWKEEGNPLRDLPRRFLHWPLEFPEVALPGFAAMVANPPFKGSQSLSGAFGDDYRAHLVGHVAAGRRGKADLVGYFALRMAALATHVGFLATNSISQGDTARVSLGPLTREGWTIHHAKRMAPWPGRAGVNISRIWMCRDTWSGPVWVDGQAGEGIITPTLERASESGAELRPLPENRDIAFQGYQIVCDKFIIDQAQEEALLATDPRSAEIIRPFVNGKLLNGPLPHQDHRRVIDFGVMSETEAKRYRACYEYVLRHVKPEVQKKAAPKPDGRASSYAAWASRWWQFWSPRPELREATSDLERVLALVRTSKVLYPTFVPADACLTDSLIVFARDDFASFAFLSSSFHWWWAVRPPGTGGSTLKTDPRYTPSVSFQTLPLPPVTTDLEAAGKQLHELRSHLMRIQAIGLVQVYRSMHDPDDQTAEAGALREAHRHVDHAVLEAYRGASGSGEVWDGLELEHGFVDCEELGLRWTIHRDVRARALEALSELNSRRSMGREHGHGQSDS